MDAHDAAQVSGDLAVHKPVLVGVSSDGLVLVVGNQSLQGLTIFQASANGLCCSEIDGGVEGLVLADQLNMRFSEIHCFLLS